MERSIRRSSSFSHIMKATSPPSPITVTEAVSPTSLRRDSELQNPPLPYYLKDEYGTATDQSHFSYANHQQQQSPQQYYSGHRNMSPPMDYHDDQTDCSSSFYNLRGVPPFTYNSNNNNNSNSTAATTQGSSGPFTSSSPHRSPPSGTAVSGCSNQTISGSTDATTNGGGGGGSPYNSNDPAQMFGSQSGGGVGVSSKNIELRCFVGGLSRKTEEEDLYRHFSTFGVVTEALIVRDRLTQRSRGFGFVVFSSPDEVDKALACPRHQIDGVTCELRRALGKDAVAVINSCKVYVSGVTDYMSQEDLKRYFESKYGPVLQCWIMRDRESQRCRGFAFVVFERHEDAENSLGMHPDLGCVEVKRAQPRRQQQQGPSPTSNSPFSTGCGFGDETSLGPTGGNNNTDPRHYATHYQSGASPFAAPTPPMTPAGPGNTTTAPQLSQDAVNNPLTALASMFSPQVLATAAVAVAAAVSSSSGNDGQPGPVLDANQQRALSMFQAAIAASYAGNESNVAPSFPSYDDNNYDGGCQH